MRKAVSYAVSRAISPIRAPRWLPTPARQRARRAAATLREAALGIVAAGMSLCIIPTASQRQRPDDVCYRIIKDENATSPIIMSFRRDDAKGRIEEIKQLIREMYADNPPWLQLSNVQLDGA